MRKILMTALTSSFILSACGGGGSGGANSGPVGYDPLNPTPVDFHKPISSSACMELKMFVDDWSEELERDITFGDAACVKKDIEQGKLDVNKGLKKFGEDQLILPIWHALEDSPLFFANSKIIFGVVKVLVEAGADLSVRNNAGDTPLHYVLGNEEVRTKYPDIASYFIQSKKAPFSIFNNQGLSPYHVAIAVKSNRHVDEMLINEQVSPNQLLANGKKPLLFAFQSQYPSDGLVSLLSRGIDFDVHDNDSNNALMLAIKSKLTMVITILIDRFSQDNLNAINGKGETALFMAINYGLTPASNLLLDKKVNPDLAPFDSSPLHRALELKDMTIANRLIEVVKNLNVKKGSLQLSVAHLVVSNGTVSQLERLRARGIAIDLKDANGNTPLAEAVALDLPQQVAFLLDSKVDIQTKNNNGDGLLSQTQSLAVAQLLVRNNVAVNTTNNAGYPAVFLFIYKGQNDIVNYLIKEAHVNLSWKDSQNENDLLFVALEQDHVDVAKTLLAQGFKTNTLNKYKQNVAFYAQSEAALDLISSPEYKTRFDLVDKSGRTCLSDLITSYYPNFYVKAGVIVKLLNINTPNPIDVNWKAANGMSLLHLVVRGGPLAGSVLHPETNVLEAFLKAGADVNIRSLEGDTPLHFADTVSEAQLLVQYGAETKIKNYSGKTAKDLQDERLTALEEQLALTKDILVTSQKALTDAQNAGKPANVINQLQNVVDQNTKRVLELQTDIQSIQNLIAYL